MSTDPKTHGDNHETSQIRDNIAKTRDDMSGTIEELHGRLNPAVLKEQALDQFHDAKETVKSELKAEFYSVKSDLKVEFEEAKNSIRKELKSEFGEVKARLEQELLEAKTAVHDATIGKVEHMVHNTQETVKATGNSVLETIKENPIPAALAGIGIAWLFMNSSSARRQRNSTMVSNVGHKIQRKAGDVAQQASQLAQQAGSSISGVAHGASETVSHFAHDAQAKAMSLGHDAQSTAMTFAHDAQVQAMRLEHRAEQSFRTNPLAVGFALLAVGTAVGLAIPSTRREDEWMGDARDNVLGKAQTLAQGALDRVEDVAKHVAADATRALKENGNSNQKGASTF